VTDKNKKKCIGCGKRKVTRKEAQQQYDRMIGRGFTPEAAKRHTPYCYKCYYGAGYEATALWAARQLPFYDDAPKPVRQHASTPSEGEITLSFALMQNLADRISERDEGYCDAPTATGRAYQAAQFVAKAHMEEFRNLWEAEIQAAAIVNTEITKYITEKRPSTDERSSLRNRASLFSLGGMSSYDLGDAIGYDPRNLRRLAQNDIEAIEQRFGHFCKNNTKLRKKWRLPKDNKKLRAKRLLP
jgi:hypothetical protein